MILQELFEKNGYINIIKKIDADQYKLFVDMFYNDEEKIPDELKYIYISKTKDELFFVLDSRGHEISKLCQEWDRKISAFMTFGSSDKEILKNLKYNVIQIVLFEAPIADRSEEGSLNVTRKILMPCNILHKGTIEIPDDEAVELPFYLIDAREFEENVEVMDRLKKCLPNSTEKALEFLNEKRKLVQKRKDENKIFKKNFNEKEYSKIKEWLNTYANTND